MTQENRAPRKKLPRTYVKTPTVYQMEATECGAASLAMILAYYGRIVPLEQLRIDAGVSRDGCNARNVLRAARKYGLTCKGWSKSVEDLLKLKTPCILHWNFNHFVVFEGIKGGCPYINDPAVGRRKLTMQDLDDCFTGIVLTFEKGENFKKGGKRAGIGEFMKARLKGQGSVLALMLVLGILLAVPGLVLPVFSQVFIDDILLGGSTSWTTALLTVMGGTVLLQAVLTWLKYHVLQNLQNKLALLSVHQFLSRMFRLPLSFFDQRYAGDLSQRVENNNNVSTFLAGDLADTALNIFIALFYLILMLLYSPLLTAVGVAGVLLNLGVAWFGGRYLSGETMKMQQDQGKMVGAVYSGLTVTDTLKASGAENEYAGRVLGYYAKNVSLEQRLGKVQEFLNALPDAVQQASRVLVLMAGGLLVIQGTLTPGMLTAFNSLLASFTDPVNKLISFVQKIQTTRADMNRVQDIENYPLDERFADSEQAELETRLNGKVELQDVAFGYSRLEPPLIEHFSFRLSCGQSIAFVGASGCGKSTVSKIISGLYTPWEGRVLFDGVPLAQIPRKILACSVATVSQSITLFSGTIRDNLTMWNPYVMEQDIVNAAKDACIHETITRLPGAYDYPLTEGGGNLSGGQRQRLEIARALVANPSILILDEATSALDPITEKQIMNNIKRRGCTCIIVAHRLSAIRDCDQIIVMERGKIVQRGTHEELKNQDGHYQRLIQNI